MIEEARCQIEAINAGRDLASELIMQKRELAKDKKKLKVAVDHDGHKILLTEEMVDGRVSPTKISE